MALATARAELSGAEEEWLRVEVLREEVEGGWAIRRRGRHGVLTGEDDAITGK